MQIQKNPHNAPQLRDRKPADAPKQPDSEPSDSFQPSSSRFPGLDFYNQNQTAVHIGGGALIGAGIARLAGLPSEGIMSTAGTGALAGWLAGSPRKAMCMAGGAAVGATIASIAGLNGPALMSAVGTGTMAGWILS